MHDAGGTTTTPLGGLSLAARPDRFEVDYLIGT